MEKKKNENISIKKWFKISPADEDTIFFTEKSTAALEVFRIASAFFRKTGKKVVVAMPTYSEAEQFAGEAEVWNHTLETGLTTALLPEGIWKGNPTPEDEAPRAEMLAAALSPKSPDIFFASVHALLTPVPNKREFSLGKIVLRKGDTCRLSELAEKLVKMGYDDEPEATIVGEFARRGGLIDIFSPGMKLPVRIEFFGDEIDTMRQYSADTGRSVQNIEECEILLRSGTVLPVTGESYSDFSSYVPDRILIICSPQECLLNLNKFGEKGSEQHWEQFRQAFTEHPIISILSEMDDDWKDLPDRDCIGITPQLQAEAGLNTDTLDELSKGIASDMVRRQLEQGYRIYFAAAKESDEVHISNWLQENKLQGAPGTAIIRMPIPCGITFPKQKVSYLTERELFMTTFTSKRTVPRAAIIKERDPGEMQKEELAQMSDIEEGDFTVHLNYGLCLYHGIKTITSGAERVESLELEFADDAIIYVPVWQAHLLSRYVGSKVNILRLSKLGGTRWLKTKEDASGAARNLAAEMLRLQAIRNSSKGVAFDRDGVEEKIFDEAFPFEATEGQLKAIEAIKKDMESTKPMDRLLCGDVGYGKTEVAMRAAFKCAASGRQVAVLVPTTVLAQQHFLSFRERFAEYPLIIETLSRLKTAGEKTAIKRGLASGGIDIIIGTHALLSKEIKFHDLGLLIIDEEQRFGVAHKEQLKSIRSTVDILTMTATPIPRTLHMSISGLRDLSTITTAPTKRLPVHTIVAQYDPSLVGAAISRELSRGGQIFYLHNRVKTIDAAAEKVRKLAPDAKVAIAHGQMTASQLEDIMSEFVNGNIDILVSTTIIESGIDIPNANTIIIERADHFGLAELHQLRGRVGRWNRQAYAYLLIPPTGVMTTDARQRMSVIRRYTHLGSGFKLALSDLEIRGAGNIIGAEQSGYVDTIGFHLYCQLLKEAANTLRGIKNPKLVSTELNIEFVTFALETSKDKLAASIPTDYISEPRLRLEAYRRLASMTKEEEVDDYELELRDKFGVIPQAAKNFLATVRLRIIVYQAGWSSLSFRDGKIYLERNGEMYRRKGALPKIPAMFKPLEKLNMLLYFAREVREESGK